MTTDAAQEAGTAKHRRATGYLFVPRALQRPALILTLRRTHAYAGLYGALAFFLLGLSGVYLNHRAVLPIAGGQVREVAALDVLVEPGAIEDVAALTAWMQARYGIDVPPARGRAQGGGPAAMAGRQAEQPGVLGVSFRGPNGVIAARHVEGSNLVQVTRSAPSLLAAIIDLHKVIGVGAAFVLVMDSIAGALMLMSVTGVLLWTHLHGPRLMAVAIAATGLALAAAALWPVWLGATVP